MINYIELILSGVLWIGFTWLVSKDILDFTAETKSKYIDLNRKFFPIMLISMVFFGIEFWIRIHMIAS